MVSKIDRLAKVEDIRRNQRSGQGIAARIYNTHPRFYNTKGRYDFDPVCSGSDHRKDDFTARS